MKDPQIEPRMYREQKETLGEKKQSNGFTIKQKTKTVAYGVDTNTTSRKQMFDMLPELVETEYDKFVSPNIYKDISTLERKKTGKIEFLQVYYRISFCAVCYPSFWKYC